MNLSDRSRNTPEDLPPTQNFMPPSDLEKISVSTNHDATVTLPVNLSKTLATLSAPLGQQARTGPRYSRLGLHARGGLGEVFLAQDEELPREVALKEIRADKDDDHSRLRFLIEGTITGSLEHPGIVPVYSLGSHADGRPFYAMRMIRGQTLQQAIADLPQPVDFSSAAFRQLLQRFVTVCQTLQYTHDRGVIHRDLKPANIMVGSYGETLVVDWGLAKVIGQAEAAAGSAVGPEVQPTEGSSSHAETEQGIVLGTPAYMSPEQASGDILHLTAATDIYALGGTLYHLLTGQSPLKQPGEVANAIIRVQKGDWSPPRAIIPRIPPPLEAICLKAMAHKAADRYASARDLATDLERWLADEPITAYREPILVRTNRWLRKHPVIAATGATSLILLLIAATIISAISSTYSQQLTSAYNQLSLSHGELAFTNKQLTESHQKLNTANGELVKTNAELKVARDDAKKNEKEALVREAETKSVLDFVLEHFVAAARPETEEGGLGRYVLLRDAIQASAPYVSTSFQGQPAIQIRLHRMLAESFRVVGNFAASRREHQEVQKLLAAQGGKSDLELLQAANSIAVSYLDEGQPRKSRELLEVNLAECEKKLGAKHPLTLDSMHNLAVVYEDLSLKAKALELRETVYRERTKLLGPKHADTLKSMNNLAYSYLDDGKIPEAVKLAEDTLKLKREVLGETHHDTLGSVHTLAVIYSAAGRGPEAMQIREELLEQMTQALGPEHRDTLGVMQNLANSYAARGKPNEALRLYENAASRLVAKYGEDHPATLSAQFALATQNGKMGRNQAAISLLQDVLKRSRNVLGPHHPQSINCMRNLANEYSALNREQAALELRIEAYTRCRDTLGLRHPETLSREYDLAQQYHHLEVYNTALELRRDVYSGRNEVLGEDYDETLLSANMLARTHLALRQHAEALKLLTDLKKRREKFAVANPEHRDNAFNLGVTLGQIGEAQQLSGDYAAASDAYDRCVKQFDEAQKTYGPLGAYYSQLYSFYQFRQAAAKKLDDTVKDLAFVDKQSPPEMVVLLEARLNHMQRTGNMEEAVKTADRYEAQIKRGGVSAYEAGRAWSRVCGMTEDIAQRNQFASRAITLLGRVKPGTGPRAYFVTAEGQSYAYHFNPDLKPIRDLPEFRKILERLPNMQADLNWADKTR